MTALAFPETDLDWLRRRVQNFAEDRPGVYRMADPSGRVTYVGKAKKLRARLLTYFRARWPDDKAARILHATQDIQWQYTPSEFAALLEELRQIQRYRPKFNVQMNRSKRTVLIKVSGGPAPRVSVGGGINALHVKHYGPLTSAQGIRDGVRVLNDLLQLRDCALNMPIVFAEQGDLFGPPLRAACMRHEFGTCCGPCAGLVAAREYVDRVQTAVDFLEGRSIVPMDRTIDEMTRAADGKDFERATRWRDRFEALELLLEALSRTRSAIESLSFVYVDPGPYGDDMAYLVRRSTVRAAAPAPQTPLEHEAFAAQIEQHRAPEPDDVPLPVEDLDEMLLVMRWFNRYPSAMRRTVPVDDWLARRPAPHDIV